jgi:protein-S-isoprenylcysteine O-methyltransferase Ste14
MSVTRRKILFALVAVLALLVVADFFVTHHASFGIDGTPGFAAWFGLVSAAIAVGVAYGWGLLMRRSGERADD